MRAPHSFKYALFLSGTFEAGFKTSDHRKLSLELIEKFNSHALPREFIHRPSVRSETTRLEMRVQPGVI